VVLLDLIARLVVRGLLDVPIALGLLLQVGLLGVVEEFLLGKALAQLTLLVYKDRLHRSDVVPDQFVGETEANTILRPYYLVLRDHDFVPKEPSRTP